MKNRLTSVGKFLGFTYIGNAKIGINPQESLVKIPIFNFILYTREKYKIKIRNKIKRNILYIKV